MGFFLYLTAVYCFNKNFASYHLEAASYNFIFFVQQKVEVWQSDRQNFKVVSNRFVEWERGSLCRAELHRTLFASCWGAHTPLRKHRQRETPWQRKWAHQKLSQNCTHLSKKKRLNTEALAYMIHEWDWGGCLRQLCDFCWKCKKKRCAEWRSSYESRGGSKTFFFPHQWGEEEGGVLRKIAVILIFKREVVKGSTGTSSLRHHGSLCVFLRESTHSYTSDE